MDKKIEPTIEGFWVFSAGLRSQFVLPGLGKLFGKLIAFLGSLLLLPSHFIK